MNAEHSQPDGPGGEQDRTPLQTWDDVRYQAERFLERAEVRLQDETERLVAQRVEKAVEHRLRETEQRLRRFEDEALQSIRERFERDVVDRLAEAERSSLDHIRSQRNRTVEELRGMLSTQAEESASQARDQLQATVDERFEERRQELDRAILSQIKPRLGEWLAELKRTTASDLRSALDQRAVEVFEKFDRAVQVRLTDAQRATIEASEQRLTAAEADAHRKATAKLQAEADRLVETRFGRAVDERLERVEGQLRTSFQDHAERAAEAAGKEFERRIAEFEGRATDFEQRLTDALPGIVREVKTRLQESVAEVRGQVVSELAEEADRIKTAAAERLRRHAEHLAADAERLQRESDQRVRTEALKRLREATEQINAQAERASRKVEIALARQDGRE